MLDEERDIELGDKVLYIDEDGQGHAAFVAHSLGGYPRPRLNLTMLKADGRVANRVSVEPAEHDGARWVKLNKWAFFDEIPKEEWDEATFRERQVGTAGSNMWTQ